MKKYFHIIILLLLFSCTTEKKNSNSESASPHSFENYNTTYNIGIKSDSTSTFIIPQVKSQVEIKTEDLIESSSEPKSGNPSSYYDNSGDDLQSLKDEEAPKSTPKPKSNIKIVYVKNTKVVKESSDLSNGRIVYKIPEKMKILSTYKVLVRISKSKTIVSIYDSLSDVVRTSEIPVTETMEVKLIDLSPKEEKAFEIVDEDNAIQIVDKGDTYTEWNWSVTPVRVGNSKLEIVVSVIRGDAKKDIVYEDTVEVEKDVWSQIIFFCKEYWHFLASSIIIPFGVWFYKNRKKKSKVYKLRKI
jgi:hypothetical protein